jgi:hypothetical protein
MPVFPSFSRLIRFRWKALVVTASALLAAAPPQANGATINVRSPALVDVTTAIASARDGDTIVVPAGSAQWSSALTITKGITLQGQTTITGAGTQTPTANDQTVINLSASIQVTLTAAQSFRLTGFSLQAGGDQIVLSSTGNAPVSKVRIDHNHSTGGAHFVRLGGWVYGVADHNFIHPTGNAQSFEIEMPNYGGQNFGHGAWADFPYYGTDKFFFIEDNSIVGDGLSTNGVTCDGKNGGRVVIRHNDLNSSRPGWHGLEGNLRGFRAGEIYNNAFHWNGPMGGEMRSGTVLYHDNTWTGAVQSACMRMDIFRANGGVGLSLVNTYGFADGTGKFDKNATEADGSFVDGHPPYVFASGTVTAGSGSTTITDSTKNWTPNQWVGYSIKQNSPGNACYPKGTYITGNTSNSISFARYPATDRGPQISFNAGDSYQIHKVLLALDQPGTGKSDLLKGDSNGGVTNTVAGHTSAHQQIEPAMSWNNVNADGSAIGFGNVTNPALNVQNSTYFNLGKGLPTNGAPSEVTAIYTAAVNGVAYTGTYAYPHPLVSGSSPSPTPNPSPTATPNSTPNPPSNLRIVP